MSKVWGLILGETVIDFGLRSRRQPWNLEMARAGTNFKLSFAAMIFARKLFCQQPAFGSAAAMSSGLSFLVILAF